MVSFYSGKIDPFQSSSARTLGVQVVRYNLSERAVELLKEGTPDVKSTYRPWGELQRLEKSADSEVSAGACEIVRAVRNNPNRLIKDEEKLAKSLGINVETNPTYVRYFEKTNKVSVHWVGRTTGNTEAMKWAKLCPPNDEIKRKAVEKWLNDRQDSGK